MAKPGIPSPVVVVVGRALAEYYSYHGQLNDLFVEKGAPGEPPPGTRHQKAIEWLKRVSGDDSVDALEVLGGVLQKFMEAKHPASGQSRSQFDASRHEVQEVLARHSLSYHSGGRILAASSTPTTRSLESILRGRDLGAVGQEFNRALSSIESDPAAAITAACAILEALCKVYIEDEDLAMPSDQSIKPLWKVVQSNLRLDPSQVSDQDLKRVLSGLASIVDGVGAFRTHSGSAHGRGRASAVPASRNARLAVHSAHTLAVFVLETWQARQADAQLPPTGERGMQPTAAPAIVKPPRLMPRRSADGKPP
jgi:hypothetical protein